MIPTHKHSHGNTSCSHSHGGGGGGGGAHGHSHGLGGLGGCLPAFVFHLQRHVTKYFVFLFICFVILLFFNQEGKWDPTNTQTDTHTCSYRKKKIPQNLCTATINNLISQEENPLVLLCSPLMVRHFPFQLVSHFSHHLHLHRTTSTVFGSDWSVQDHFGFVEPTSIPLRKFYRWCCCRLHHQAGRSSWIDSFSSRSSWRKGDLEWWEIELWYFFSWVSEPPVPPFLTVGCSPLVLISRLCVNWW